jgi:hypothetical protein
MSNEITQQVGLTVRKVDATTGITTVYFNTSGQNQITLAGNSGPYVGTLSVPTTGIAVDLSGVGVPGAAWFMNQDPVNPVSIGTRDTLTGKFSPLLRLLPGMRLVLYLDPHLGIEESGAGSVSIGTDQLFLKAFNGTCKVDVNIFPQ